MNTLLQGLGLSFAIQCEIIGYLYKGRHNQGTVKANIFIWAHFIKHCLLYHRPPELLPNIKGSRDLDYTERFFFHNVDSLLFIGSNNYLQGVNWQCHFLF